MQEQRNEMKGILDEISDIIHLDVSLQKMSIKSWIQQTKRIRPYINSESLITI